MGDYFFWIVGIVVILGGAVALHFAHRSSMFGDGDHGSFDDDEDVGRYRSFRRRRRLTRSVAAPGSLEEAVGSEIPEGVNPNVVKKLLDAPIDLEQR